MTSSPYEANFAAWVDRKLLKSNIHMAMVTDANLEYDGSVTLDGALMEEADIDEYEHVYIWDLTNGTRDRPGR